MAIYVPTVTALDNKMPGANFSDTATALLATSAIEDAESEINSVLALRYNLSQAYFQTTVSVPPLVRSIAEQMAAGFVWHGLSRGGAGKESLKRGDALLESARNRLKMISEYKLALVNTTGALIPDMSDTSYRVLCNTSDYTPTFNEDDELSHQIDPDKLDDISNERG